MTSFLTTLSGQAVRLVEVGPRDGLQAERAYIPTIDKIALVNRLAAAGHRSIEVSSFVSPSRVPQLADAAEVFAGITRQPGVHYSALVPNLKGLHRAIAARVDGVAIFTAASETFSMKNLSQGIEDSLTSYTDACAVAHKEGLRVRGYLSVSFGCPFDGPVPPTRVAEIAGRLLDAGVDEVSISDTIGVAHPAQVADVIGVVAATVPLPKLALHFHDTRGTALANVVAGLEAGVRTFDASAGGLGGCPYAPGASGNLATEDLLYLLDGLGMTSGVSLPGIIAASRSIAPLLAHDLPSRVVRAAAGGSRNWTPIRPA